MTVLTQDLFYSTFFSTWFPNVDNRNNFDDRIGPCSLTRDVERLLMDLYAKHYTRMECGLDQTPLLDERPLSLFQGSVSDHG